MLTRRTARFLLALSMCIIAPRADAQASPVIHRDVIRGTITTDSGHVVAGADVIVTMAPDRSYLSTKTDSSGRYEILFEHGTGDYLVHVAAAGMQTARLRVTRVGDDSVMLANFKLAPIQVQQLAAVNVRARAVRPSRFSGREDAAGSEERDYTGVKASVAPGDIGSIAAAAATHARAHCNREWYVGRRIGSVAELHHAERARVLRRRRSSRCPFGDPGDHIDL